MKRLILTLTALVALPLSAEAGGLTDKAYRVAAQLGTQEVNLTPAQQAAVNRNLDGILAALNGSPTPDRSYICVSRDNDNSRPYVLAYKDFANVVRIPTAAFGTMDECQESLNAGQRYFDQFFVCANRDNDGTRPFKIVSLNGTNRSTMLRRSVLSTLDDCLTAVRAMQFRPEGVLYCGSRDNDGSHPFAQTGLMNDGTFIQGREEYSSLSDCIRAL